MPDLKSGDDGRQRQAIDLRNRAEELRAVGENTRNAEARRILMDLANEADQRAGQLEGEVARSGARPKP